MKLLQNSDLPEQVCKLKKSSSSVHINLPPAKIFLTDLEMIEDLFLEHASDNKLNIKGKIGDDVYSIPNISSLKNFGRDKLDTISFSIDSLTVDFYFDETKVVARSNDVISLGIIEKLKEILAIRLCKFRSVVSKSFDVLMRCLFLTSITAVFVSIFSTPLSKLASVFVGVVIILLFFEFVLNFAFFSRTPYTKIILKLPHEIPSFFMQHRERFINLLFTLIGGIITLLLSRLLR